MRFIFFSSRICLLLKVFIINDQEIISKNSNIANEIHDSPIMGFSCMGQCFQDKSYRNQKSTQYKGFPNLDGSRYAMWIVVIWRLPSTVIRTSKKFVRKGSNRRWCGKHSQCSPIHAGLAWKWQSWRVNELVTQKQKSSPPF